MEFCDRSPPTTYMFVCALSSPATLLATHVKTPSSFNEECICSLLPSSTMLASFINLYRNKAKCLSNKILFSGCSKSQAILFKTIHA